MLKDFELDNYLFGVKSNDLNGTDEKAIRQRLQQEMLEIFYGRNIAK
jgi:S-adenosylmethionine decarboxylase